MSSSCIEDLSIRDNQWYRIAHEMLGLAGIEINGSRPFDIQVKTPISLNASCSKGRWGWAKAIWTAGGSANGWICSSSTWSAPGWRRSSPPSERYPAYRRSAPDQSAIEKRARIVGKEHYDLGNDLFTLMLDPYMQYSCGYWKDATTLEEAQEAKLRMICENCSCSRACACWISVAAGAAFLPTRRKITACRWSA